MFAQARRVMSAEVMTLGEGCERAATGAIHCPENIQQSQRQGRKTRKGPLLSASVPLHCLLV